jgi:hypothetical protein
MFLQQYLPSNWGNSSSTFGGYRQHCRTTEATLWTAQADGEEPSVEAGKIASLIAQE